MLRKINKFLSEVKQYFLLWVVNNKSRSYKLKQSKYKKHICFWSIFLVLTFPLFLILGIIELIISLFTTFWQKKLNLVLGKMNDEGVIDANK